MLVVVRKHVPVMNLTKMILLVINAEKLPKIVFHVLMEYVLNVTQKTENSSTILLKIVSVKKDLLKTTHQIPRLVYHVVKIVRLVLTQQPTVRLAKIMQPKMEVMSVNVILVSPISTKMVNVLHVKLKKIVKLAHKQIHVKLVNKVRL